MFRTAAFSLFLFTTSLLAGCSDSQQEAISEGAIAQAQYDAGQIDAARVTIRKAIMSRDDIVDLYLLQGRIEAAAKSPGGAFGAYNNALSLDSANGEALLGVAHFGMETGRVQDSEDAADRILTLDPRQPDALLIKGIYNLVHRRGEDALVRADAILEQTPNNENGLILKARALSLLDRSDEALELVADLAKRSGVSESTTLTLLELYRFKNNGPAMLSQIEILRRAKPGDFPLILDDANARYKLGDMARARALLLGMIRQPRIGDVDARLVTDLWTEYDPQPLDDKAVANLAVRGSQPAKEAAARFYLHRNDAARAFAVLGSDTSSPDIVALKAQIAIATGKVAQGLGMADAILKTDDTHCDALLARAKGLLAMQRYKETVITSQVANANCPRLVPAFITLVRANDALNNSRASEITFRTGVARNTQDSGLTALYAAWLERRGENQRAVVIARQVTRAAPALVSGWRLYVDLCKKYPDEDCADDAEEGLQRAKVRFAVDRRPDDPEPTGLFSRLRRDDDKDDFNAEAAARSRTKTTPATDVLQ